MKIHTDIMKEFKKRLTKKEIAEVKEEAQKELFQIRLSELRKRKKIRQKDIHQFSQSSLSKIESRTDVKISTLLEYAKSTGYDIEIKAYPHGEKHNKSNGITLLEVSN